MAFPELGITQEMNVVKCSRLREVEGSGRKRDGKANHVAAGVEGGGCAGIPEARIEGDGSTHAHDAIKDPDQGWDPAEKVVSCFGQEYRNVSTA